jgi:hypothetical protein
MSIQAVAWALEQDIPARPKLVLVAICNHANHTDGYCWLKAETIEREAACTPRSVFNFVGMLIRNGFIRKALRRSEDGKQRANDYWVLFEREDKPWESAAQGEPSEPQNDGEENAPTEDDDTISGMPHERGSCGENYHQHEPDSGSNVDLVSPRSCGPHESGFHRYNEEPSKTNPKASSARARVRGAAPRAYHPPPPQALGEDTEFKREPIFVFEGTPAYEAWAAHKAKQLGINRWNCTTRKFIEKDNCWRSGWNFPTLFPPAYQSPKTDPPILATEQDLQDFAILKLGNGDAGNGRKVR